MGAIIQRLLVPDRDGNLADVVLGFDDLESYVAHSPYFGAVPGRCANRISNATVTIDGTTYQLGANENGNQLHGGTTGFSNRVWSLEQHDKGSVLLKYVSEDGEEGEPRSLRVAHGIAAAVAQHAGDAAGSSSVMESETSNLRTALVGLRNIGLYK